jgi:hypothetical protein
MASGCSPARYRCGSVTERWIANDFVFVFVFVLDLDLDLDLDLIFFDRTKSRSRFSR